MRTYVTSTSAIVLTMAIAGVAQAQTTRPDTVAEIVVTGSRLASTVAAESAAVPVQIIGQAEISLAGQRSVDDLLKRDPAIAGRGGVDGSRSNGNGAGSAINLRGLGDRYTLVLVNGKRFAANAPASVSEIPLSAIDRVEILKGGASSIYGSDAIGGAVNFILKTDPKNNALNLRYTDTGHGGPSAVDGDATFGFRTDNSRAVLSLAYAKRGALMESDRAITASQDKRPYGGIDGRSDAGNPARIILPGSTVPIILDETKVAVGQFTLNPANYRTYVPNTDLHDRVRTQIAGSEYYTAYGRFGHDIFGGAAEAYLEAFYSDRVTRPSNGTSVVDFRLVGAVPTTNPYNPFGVAVTNIRWRALEDPSLFKVRAKAETQRYVAGLTGSLKGLDYNLSITRFDLDRTITNPNNISLSGMRTAVNRTGADAFNPFCNRCNTPAQYAGVRITTNNRYDNAFTSGEFGVSGSFFKSDLFEVAAAGGVELRREEYGFTPDLRIQRADVADNSAQVPFSADRNISSVYGEARFTLLNTDSATGPVEAKVAVRREHYSDVGSTTNPSVSLRWEVIPQQLTLRSSYSRSFRAPYLEELSTATASSNTTLRDPLTNAPADVTVITGSNPKLNPERATSTSFGVVFQPKVIDRLFMSIDYYKIQQTQLVFAPSAQLVFLGVAPGVVRRGVVSTGGRDIIIEALLANAARRQTTGVDFTVSKKGDLTDTISYGVDLNASRLLHFKNDVGDGKGYADYAGEYAVFDSLSSGALPKWKGSVTGDIGTETLRAAVTVNYLGGLLQQRLGAANPANPGSIPRYTTVDAQLSYKLPPLWVDQAQLRIGVVNAFNKLPPFIIGTNDIDRFTYDVSGRMAYVTLGLRF